MTDDNEIFSTTREAGAGRALNQTWDKLREDEAGLDDAHPEDDAAGDDETDIAELTEDQPGLLESDRPLFDDGEEVDDMDEDLEASADNLSAPRPATYPV